MGLYSGPRGLHIKVVPFGMPATVVDFFAFSRPEKEPIVSTRPCPRAVSCHNRLDVSAEIASPMTNEGVGSSEGRESTLPWFLCASNVARCSQSIHCLL